MKYNFEFWETKLPCVFTTADTDTMTENNTLQFHLKCKCLNFVNVSQTDKHGNLNFFIFFFSFIDFHNALEEDLRV